MKRINQEQNRVPSFSSSSSTSANRSDGVLEYWSVGIQTSENWAQSKVASPYSASHIGINNNRTSGSSFLPVRFFRGLSLELFAGSVMNNETVLPKAVKTAGLMMPRLNWASDASPRRAATISLERRVVSKQ
jgi:hypothetical protein